MKANADMLFEVSWEITNKCGGIYTVVSSKAQIMQSYYDSYFCIGPLFDNLPNEFHKETIPDAFASVVHQLSLEGIRIEYGTWAIKGSPKTFLIDARAIESKANEIKGKLWDKFQVDTINSAGDFVPPMVWSYAVGMFLETVSKVFSNKQIVSQLHEWLSGFALLYLKEKNSSVATVFTTHATMLGRTLAQNNFPIYESLDTINPEEEAKKYGVMDKFSTERACALNSDVFTTVSDITAVEANSIFGRRPDVLPNGLMLSQFPNFETASIDHLKAKKRLQDVARGYFFPYYQFDLNKTLFYYFGGRYEFGNKGMDISVSALGKLNENLKNKGSSKTIVMFYFIAMDSGDVKRDVLENKDAMSSLKSATYSVSHHLASDIIDIAMRKGNISEISENPELKNLFQKASHVKRQGNPPICSHMLPYDENADSLISACKKAGLNNNKEDRVKVIMVPSYLGGSDNLIDLPYYQAVSGCHLGIFSSYYEPWGYTPMESMAMGVPAITTSVSGFGKFMKDKLATSHSGLFVIPWEQDREIVTTKMFEVLKTYQSFDVHARVACKMNSHRLAKFADWTSFVLYYIKAHNKALANHK